MSENMLTINICIATFKRPVLLKKLLESLNGLNLEPDMSCRIIVVDNDKKCSAKKIVREFAFNARFPVVYDIEPVQNIALTRNRALSHTSGGFVAFIDDDEYADPDWIVQHLRTIERFHADASCGPVLPEYDEEIRGWIRKGGFFERPRHKEGAVILVGITGNTLFKYQSVDRLAIKFNTALGLIGGEDTDFFLRLSNAGGKLVWCDSAIVHEQVSKERACMKWLIKRAFRTGKVFASITMQQMTITKKIYWVLKRITYLALSLVMVPFAFLLGRIRLTNALMRAARCMGQLVL